MIVDLPPHAIDLLIYLCGKLLMSCRSHLLRLVRQHRQRRLQAMRKIAAPAFATARATRRSRSLSSAFNSSTAGCTSAG